MAEALIAGLIAVVLALAILAEYYRGGRDDLATWALYVSRVVHRPESDEDIVKYLKTIVLDEDDL